MNLTLSVRTIHTARTRSHGASMVTLLCVLAISACRGYEARPLDDAPLREAWLARTADDGSVQDFARRLSAAEGHCELELDASDGLTLAEAEVVALVFNRELRVQRLEAGVQRANAEHAGLWQDPVLGVNLERVLESVQKPWVASASLGFTIPLSGRLQAEREHAGALHRASLLRVAAQEWRTRVRLRELWVMWSAQRARERLYNEHLRQLRDVCALVDRRVKAGESARAEAGVFLVALAKMEADLFSARTRSAELEFELRETMGLSPRAPLELVEQVTYTTEPEAQDASLQALAARNLDIIASRAEYDAAEHALRTQIRAQYPELTVGPGIGVDEGDDRVLLGIELPLPLWNRNRRAIAEAEAQRDAARGRFESELERLSHELLTLRHAHTLHTSMREHAETRLAPLADEQITLLRQAAEQGRLDPLLLNEALHTRLETMIRLIDARTMESLTRVRIDALFGPERGTRNLETLEHGGAHP